MGGLLILIIAVINSLYFIDNGYNPVNISVSAVIMIILSAFCAYDTDDLLFYILEYIVICLIMLLLSPVCVVNY